MSKGKACWEWYNKLKEIGAEWGLDEISFTDLVFKNSPKCHSASSHHS
jgi:hypothetical protein